MSGARPIRWLLSKCEGLLDRLLCVLGAVLFAQLPEFMQQYLQRLGGHLDEARRQLENLRSAAERSGMTLKQLIADASSNPDPAIVRLGGVVRETSARVDSLAAASDALLHASAFTRPFVFLRHLDPSIAKATLSIFRPAVPTTFEGLVYALLGVVALLAFYRCCIRSPAVKLWRAARKQAPLSGEAVGKV